MDSTRAAQLCNEGETLTERLRQARIDVWFVNSDRVAGRIVAKSARLDWLISRSMVRSMRRWELWCDSND